MMSRLERGLVFGVVGVRTFVVAWVLTGLVFVAEVAAQTSSLIRTDALVVALNHVAVIDGTGAEALGIGDRVGRIQAGLQADLIVLEGALADDPSVIKNTRIVFRKGVGYDSQAILEQLKGRVGRW